MKPESYRIIRIADSTLSQGGPTEIALNCTFYFSGSCLLVVTALGYSNPRKQLLINGNENA
jgi:hypothetical protein